MSAREGNALLGEAVVVDANIVDGAVGRHSCPARDIKQVGTLKHNGCNTLRPDIPTKRNKLAQKCQKVNANPVT